MLYFYGNCSGTNVNDIFVYDNLSAERNFYDSEVDLPWNSIKGSSVGFLYDRRVICKSLEKKGYFMCGGGGGVEYSQTVIINLQFKLETCSSVRGGAVYNKCIEKVTPYIREEKINRLLN